jgi:hypothetical protein
VEPRGPPLPKARPPPTESMLPNIYKLKEYPSKSRQSENLRKKKISSQKHYRTFPIKVLKSRIPGISSPAHIKEMRTARHES